MEIRPLRINDEDTLRTLCLENTHLRRRLQSERYVIWQSFGQYYLDCEARHCFLADDGAGAAGAVLCAPDYAAYMRRFMGDYFPKCKPYGYSAAATARQTMLLQRKLAGHYPAHLHAMWPEDRQDLAGPLIEALSAHLEAIECRGVCAFPDAKKQPALCDSLESLGFKTIGKTGSVLQMGKELF